MNTILPEPVVRVLNQTPKVTESYFFWDGTQRIETATGGRRRRLAKVFELAKVDDAHPHRFRDTFAVELLLSGVPIERVSVLLGHQSVRITEKHYAPWVRSRQEQLESDLTNAWRHDSMISSLQQVHAGYTRSSLAVSLSLHNANLGGAGGNRTHA